MNAPAISTDTVPSRQWPRMVTVFTLVLCGLAYAGSTALFFFMSGALSLTDAPTPARRLMEVACMNMLMALLASRTARQRRAGQMGSIMRHAALLAVVGSSAALASVSGSLLATIASLVFMMLVVWFVIAQPSLRRHALVIALFSIPYVLAISASLSHFAQ